MKRQFLYSNIIFRSLYGMRNIYNWGHHFVNVLEDTIPPENWWLEFWICHFHYHLPQSVAWFDDLVAYCPSEEFPLRPYFVLFPHEKYKPSQLWCLLEQVMMLSFDFVKNSWCFFPQHQPLSFLAAFLLINCIMASKI